MVGFPNCKINLGLHITRKREDGYHDLETVFYPLPVKDVLEIITNPAPNNPGPVQYSASGIPIQGKTDDNLCIKAYHLLKKDFPQIPAIQMHLHKNIPMGAGLGGGSADGAFTLLLLNRKYQLGLGEAALMRYALALGSDCPFFIINKPCLGKGRGEILSPIELNLSTYRFLIVNPGIHINTGWAFSNINPATPKKTISSILEQPISAWRGQLINDFERPVSEKYPEIAALISKLYDSGAIYAALSGTGSTVFGIFPKGDPALPEFPNHYTVKLVD